jgi:hypothetical protein
MSEGGESGAQRIAETHRTLRITEIVCLICSHLNPVPGAGVADLANLACTSKILHDPALDALWRDQDTIMNLMRCMPDVWETPDPPHEYLVEFLNAVADPVVKCIHIQFQNYSLTLFAPSDGHSPNCSVGLG